MKKHIHIILLTSALILASCGSKDVALRQLSAMDNVTSIHIPGILLSLAKDKAKLDKKELSDLSISGIRGLRILATEDKEAATALYSNAKRIAKEQGYELLIKARDEGESADIYIKQKGKRVQLLIIGNDDEETGVVSFSAKIKQQDLQKLLSADKS